MSDYIKREDVLALKGNCCYDKDGLLLYAVGTGDIMRIPSADVVEVVRCKDCKFFTRAIDPNGDVWNCCGERMEFVCPDDYCSYGERKEK